MNNQFTRILFLSFIFLITSCTSKKQLAYLNDSNIGTEIMKSKSSYIIQKNDVLRIEIFSLFPEASVVYNRIPKQISSTPNVEMLELDGYIVSSDFTINLPVLGVLNVEGSLHELEKKIIKILLDGEHLVSPTVIVRILSSKFTVLGEVTNPGTYKVLNNNLNLFQALGYAGDLTINGSRRDITFIREVNGVRTIKKIDITSKDVLNNPFTILIIMTLLLLIQILVK